MTAPPQVHTIVTTIVSFQVGLGDCSIGPSETLLDVGTDSLDCMEILMRCEERFEITLSDDDVTLSSTVADIAGVIFSKLRDKALVKDGVERARMGGVS